MYTDIVIAAFFFLLGLIPAYYFYRKSIRIKDPVFSIKSANIFSDHSTRYKGLAISYRGKKVENFTVSKVLFYNRGAETIQEGDVASKLCILSLPYKILEATILQTNNPVNRFSVGLATDSAVVIEFEYVDQNQGVVVEVIHTGLTSKDLKIDGGIKGVRTLTQVPPDLLQFSNIREYRVILISSLLLIPLSTAFFYLLLQFGFARTASLAAISSPLVVFVISLALAVSAMYAAAKKVYGRGFKPFQIQTRLPRGLEKFLE